MHRMCDPASLCGGLEGKAPFSRKLLLYFEYYECKNKESPG